MSNSKHSLEMFHWGGHQQGDGKNQYSSERGVCHLGQMREEEPLACFITSGMTDFGSPESSSSLLPLAFRFFCGKRGERVRMCLRNDDGEEESWGTKGLESDVEVVLLNMT